MAWQRISTEVNEKSFKKCCISSAVVGTCDDMWWNVCSECDEDGDSGTEW